MINNETWLYHIHELLLHSLTWIHPVKHVSRVLRRCIVVIHLLLNNVWMNRVEQ